MGKAKLVRKERAPRAVGGGRSARYSARRDARGATTQYAAAWSDAASKAVLDALHARWQALQWLLTSQDGLEAIIDDEVLLCINLSLRWRLSCRL